MSFFDLSPLLPAQAINSIEVICQEILQMMKFNPGFIDIGCADRYSFHASLAGIFILTIKAIKGNM